MTVFAIAVFYFAAGCIGFNRWARGMEDC